MSTSEIHRRAEIVSQVEKVRALIDAAAREGALGRTDQAVISSIRHETQRALNQFLVGDEEIAWWAQVELFAGLAEPLGLVREGKALVDADGDLLFSPPRSSELREWEMGIGPGPRFEGHHASAPTHVDSFREQLVSPYSEAPASMLWAPILDWRNSQDEPKSEG